MKRCLPALLLTILMCVSFCFWAVDVNAEVLDAGTCGDTAVWSITDDTLTIAGVGEMYDYAAEEAPWFAYRNDIRSIEIQEGITHIGNYAFYYISAWNISISDSVESIGFRSFQGTYIEEVQIPESVVLIEEPAFANAWNLERIVVDKDNPKYCAVENVLYTKDMTELVCYPSLKSDAFFCVPKEVKKIRREAFRGCYNLVEVEMQEGVEEIGMGAFRDCSNLMGVFIPKSTTYIGADAFSEETDNDTGKYIFSSVVYAGTESQWMSVDVDEDNVALKQANIRFQKAKESNPGLIWFVVGVLCAGAVSYMIFSWRRKEY